MGAPSSDSAGIRQIIRALKAAGYTPFMAVDGEGEEHHTQNEQELIENLTSCDDGTLYVRLPEGSGRKTSHVYFVLGNDPEEVACDWGISLSPVLDPLTESWWS